MFSRLTGLLLPLTSLITLALSQGGVPLCATSCIVLPQQCGTDPKCICSDQQWISDISCCVFKQCDAQDQGQALTYAQQICNPVGATLPSQASCSNSTASATNGTTTASGGATSSTKSASSASSAASSAAASSSAKSGGNVVAVEGLAAGLLGVVALL